MRSQPDLQREPDAALTNLFGRPLFATAEEKAYAAELATADRAEDLTHAAERDTIGEAGSDWTDDAGWDAVLMELNSSDAGAFVAPDDDVLAELDDAPLVEPSPWTDDDLVASLRGPAHDEDLLLLSPVDPATLSDDHARVDYLRTLDRIAARVAAKRAEVVVALAGTTSSGAYLPEIHLEQEIATARRTSRYAAGRLVENARALATSFQGFAAALRDGEISEAHCSILVERTRVVADPAVLVEIERRALPKAKRLTPGEFVGEVAKVIARLDRDAAERVRRARASRRVVCRQLEDGMGYLAMTHEWPTIHAIQQAVRVDGRALQLARRAAAEAAERADGAACGEGVNGGVARADRGESVVGVEGVEGATADSCRADALAARILGQVDDDGSVSWDRSQVAVTTNVVIDLDTLRGEADRIALLDGQPVPAEIGREVARFATSWRRLVTDPVDGHLLDYGRTVYLPDRLRAYVFARDGGCRAPGCTNRAASRLQLDHAIPFPHGPSSTSNTGALCTTCHQLKTAGFADVTDSRPDGSATWRTAWGQTVHVPAHAVLADPDPPSTPKHSSPDPPPF